MTSQRQVPRHSRTEFRSRTGRHVVVIPVINEGDRIIGQLMRMSALGDHAPDVVIADGGSTDGSMQPERLAGLGVRTLLTKHDEGRLSAQLRMAFAYVLDEGYEGVITIDGNGKDGVEAIPAFCEALDDGFDFVQGSRFLPGGVEENTPRLRRAAIRCVHAPAISLIAGSRYTDTTNGYRGHSRRYLTHPEVQPFRDVFDAYELLAYLSVRADQLGLRTTELPVARRYPPKGRTPTKIHPVRGNAELLRTLVRTARGDFTPTPSRGRS